MIDFRYHLVSIIAIFMALAVGIVLGSGPLREPIDNTISQQADQLREQRNDLQEELRLTEQRVAYQEDVVAALGAGVTDGRLAGRRVVLVTAPGADPEVAQELGEAVAAAGGTVTGTVGVVDTWLDPANEEELDEVTSRLVLPGTTFPEDSDARERMDTVLASALVTRSPRDDPQSDPGAQALLTGLEELGHLTVDGTPSERAGLALVVAAPAPEDAAVAGVQTGGLVDLVAALDRQGAGTVVAGTQSANSEGGLVREVRTEGATEGSVSTVDTADSAAGRLSAVLALDAEAEGATGAYGYGAEADEVLPELADAP
ncbi:copper transporter [Vallicoccus soli]|uniref:Copper transporter n=1 Tax=Vallicoccus soli TaxID=2339232 RepID=A0A3A3ZDJ3_9ACTN|nr:copper transporter [Vallicoccus soli]RJK93116.1 copper transporter [Vallicoccus soli]